MAELYQHTVWDAELGGTGNHVLDGGADALKEEALLRCLAD